MLAMILTALAPLTVIGACVGAGIAAIAAFSCFLSIKSNGTLWSASPTILHFALCVLHFAL